jgi:pseudaminic acid biosynthesis-associated methylase
MHEPYRTDQETFWAGPFGDDYARRNRDAKLHASNLAFFTRALAKASPIATCLEVGANIGMNLSALAILYPGQRQHAVEINQAAASELRARVPAATVSEGSILDLDLVNIVPNGGFDLVLTKGVLIHINPEYLDVVYDKLQAASGRYLLICEYYNPVPVAVEYRGHAERLYKRDFAGELLARFPLLELLDYGFAYRLDRSFPQDDITWFLMQKPAAGAR